MKVYELFEEHEKYLDTLHVSEKNIEDGHFKEDYSNLIVDGDFDCYHIPTLTSLEGSPYQVRDMDLRACVKLKSLRGAPTIATRNVYIGNTGITTLKGIGKDYLEEIGGNLYLPIGKITSNILGLLKIKSLKEFVFFTSEDEIDVKAFSIVKKHFESGKNIRKCRAELIEAGLEEYAQL